ncbi:MAG: HAD family hydrolase [Deltaproteobacteria bacterium]|nr:HAD family hydrolase [Deltaproteobacteria bacterium]
MKLIMFDYDGVLIDSLAVTSRIYKDISDAFQLGFPEDLEFYQDLFELDWRATMKKINLGEEHWSKTEEIYVEGLRKHKGRVKPYDGIPTVLEALAEHHVLAIVTNNLRAEVDYTLGQYDLHKYFQASFTSEDGELKPSPDMIHKCLARFDVKPENAAFIGDMDGDIVSARAANIGKIIAVSYGYHLTPRLQDADLILDTPEEILHAFSG